MFTSPQVVNFVNPENWKVKDDVRRLTYNLLRCPPMFLDILGSMYEFTKPEIAGFQGEKCPKWFNQFPLIAIDNADHSLSAMCIENLEGDYYIPGTVPDGAQGIWREIQDSHSVVPKLYP